MARHNISVNGSYVLVEVRSIEDYAYLVFVCILSVVEIPIMILTLIALFSLIKTRPAASVFVSHLIISDLIQVIYMLIKTAFWSSELVKVYRYTLIVGLYFMACVSFERYLLVSHPVWYKSHQSLKLSCFISVIIWCVPLIFAEIDPPDIYFSFKSLSLACFIPFPIIILCFVGTWRGLSRSISLTALKRKLILGSLLLVLLTYTFIILPYVILEYVTEFEVFFSFVWKFYYWSRLLLFVNPLADCILYLFMRPDVGALMKSVCCCCRHLRSKHNQDTTVVCCISAQKPECHSLHTFSSV